MNLDFRSIWRCTPAAISTHVPIVQRPLNRALICIRIARNITTRIGQKIAANVWLLEITRKIYNTNKSENPSRNSVVCLLQ